MSHSAYHFKEFSAVAPYDIGVWNDWIPRDAAAKVNTYASIPAFNLTIDSGWLGASYIRANYAFVADRNFSLRSLPVRTVSPNFCPCISYTSGGVVYRYKLWENVGEHLFVNLYNGEKIGAAFNIEIWTTTQNVVSSAGFDVITGVLTEALSACSTDNVAEDAGIENLLLWALLEGWDPSSETLVFGIAWPGNVLVGTYITTPEGNVIFVPEGTYIIPPTDGPTPPPTSYGRITEEGDGRITEEGDERIIE